MSSNKYIDSLIGLSFIFVIFPVIPMFLRVGFLGGEFSAKASFYTLFICLVYSVWLKRHSLRQYHLYWKSIYTASKRLFLHCLHAKTLIAHIFHTGDQCQAVVTGVLKF